MILEKEIYVIDNFINIEYQTDIKNILIGDYQYKEKNFPWYYTSDITSGDDHDDSQHRAALGHDYVIIDDEYDATGQRVSIFHYLFLPMLKNVCQKMKIKNINVLQGRSFLQFPLSLRDITIDTPHIDLDNRKHLVALYYVCDSDGDTVIYNERKESKSYTIKQKVTPNQGRMVLFDGSLYHTAEQPLNNVRCIVNYNLG